MAVRCISPPESSRGLVLQSVGKPDQLRGVSAASRLVDFRPVSEAVSSRTLSAISARVPRRSSSVVQLGQQMVELEDHSEAAVSQQIAFGTWRGGCLCAGPRSGFRPRRGRRGWPTGAATYSCPQPLWPTIEPTTRPRRTASSTPRSTGTCRTAPLAKALRRDRGTEDCGSSHGEDRRDTVSVDSAGSEIVSGGILGRRAPVETDCSAACDLASRSDLPARVSCLFSWSIRYLQGLAPDGDMSRAKRRQDAGKRRRFPDRAERQSRSIGPRIDDGGDA